MQSLVAVSLRKTIEDNNICCQCNLRDSNHCNMYQYNYPKVNQEYIPYENYQF